MPSIKYNDLDTIKDPILNDKFEFVFPSIPGSFINASMDLRIKCQSVSVPGFSTQPIEVQMFGHAAKFRGGAESSRQISATFIVDSSFDTYNAFREWFGYTIDSDTGDAKGDKKDYSKRAILNIYDATGKLAIVFIFNNVFIETAEVGEVQSAGSDPMIMTMTFSYDYVDYQIISLNSLGSRAIGLFRNLVTNTIDKIKDKIMDNLTNSIKAKITQAKNLAKSKMRIPR